MKTNTAIHIRDVSKAFASEKLFQSLDLEIDTGEFVTLLGSSGCGKTTVLRMLAGLDSPTSGQIHIPDPLKQSTSYVFQDANLLPWKTVTENVALPFQVGSLKDKYSVTQIQEISRNALAKVHLEKAAHLFPHELSGGMKMRVSLARAIATSPKLLLMDEPFAALDEVTRFEMQNQLLELWQTEKMTIVFVTHSLFEAAYLSQRVVLMKKSGSINQIKLDLPEKRDEKLRTSEKMIHIVQDLSERFRA
ncbi:nitrate ABC transporter ATP-binding protein [Bdellovibrio bacteriovorus]|uniref:Nitrate ABC transporter ATP-binding protein n=1 Tax=Bdellovibrio bacteriovorus TaxID=959 RepID=A0A150WK57_BDEBC|nr:ABC transporter ATP-binding protein [Bdellovibrio bacteriovorus]KYG63921.1 nitrate ABC transporter ATP-binding protein [Bdellovibrio bacteriovorus]